MSAVSLCRWCGLPLKAKCLVVCSGHRLVNAPRIVLAEHHGRCVVTHSLTQIVERRLTHDAIVARAAEKVAAPVEHVPGPAGMACPGCVHAFKTAAQERRQTL